MSHPGDSMLWVLSPNDIGEIRSVDAMVMTPNPRAATSIPHAIRVGALTSLPLLARAPKNAMLNGVSATTKNGLNCWKSDGCAYVGLSITA